LKSLSNFYDIYLINDTDVNTSISPQLQSSSEINDNKSSQSNSDEERFETRRTTSQLLLSDELESDYLAIIVTLIDFYVNCMYYILYLIKFIFIFSIQFNSYLIYFIIIFLCRFELYN
jgi:hypothetical protein